MVFYYGDPRPLCLKTSELRYSSDQLQLLTLNENQGQADYTTRGAHRSRQTATIGPISIVFHPQTNSMNALSLLDKDGVCMAPLCT